MSHAWRALRSRNFRLFFSGQSISLIGFGLMQSAALSNTIIQTLAPEDKRARVMSYYTMAFFGAAPIGSLLSGTLAHHIGAPHTVIVTGAFCVAGSIWFAFEMPKIRPIIWPVYQAMGLVENEAGDASGGPYPPNRFFANCSSLDRQEESP